MAQTRSIGKTNTAPILETGIVTAVDGKKALVRVILPTRSSIETDWLEVLFPGTSFHKFYGLPGIGDQVRVLLDSNLESGCILGAIYSSADQPPALAPEVFTVEFSDGGRITYDTRSSTLTVNCKKVVIVSEQESTLQGKAIAVVGASDNDSEGNGTDRLVSSGQF